MKDHSKIRILVDMDRPLLDDIEAFRRARGFRSRSQAIASVMAEVSAPFRVVPAAARVDSAPYWRPPYTGTLDDCMAWMREMCDPCSQDKHAGCLHLSRELQLSQNVRMFCMCEECEKIRKQ